MRLHQCWTRAALALCVLSGAAFADVTVSQSNDPTAADRRAVRVAAGRRTQCAAMRCPTGDGWRWPPGGGEAAAGTSRKPTPAPSRSAMTAAWLASLPAATGDAQWQCLTEALYFEARGETPEGPDRGGRGDPEPGGQPALSRARSAAWCKQRGGGGCQFSYRLRRRCRPMRERAACRPGRPHRPR